MLRVAGLAVVAALSVAPAWANDTTAELATGGLIYTRSDQVAMESEDLYISPSEVRVRYQFRNRSEEDVRSIVAFPMPTVKADPYTITSVPETASDNFLGFTVEVDGRHIEPQLDQRAYALGVDVTDQLTQHGVPLWPYGDAAATAIEALAPDVLEDWHARGIVIPEEFDDGSGWKRVWSPFWEVRSAYWWMMTFPAGKAVDVRHSYAPSVGGTVDVTFLEDGKGKGERFDEYKAKYCMDAGFVRAVEAAVAKSRGMNPLYTESWISYVLTTGGNWATTIEKFKLTIDKGSPRALVSFCGKGVKKTGPTSFEMVAQDFYPERDLDILILQPLEMGN